ncbi:MAG: hypothetical protein OEM38_10550 [Gammaproteobacteria bacterium]|nr:hypothetical protein [Gammaproteobacteria bacterium]
MKLPLIKTYAALGMLTSAVILTGCNENDTTTAPASKGTATYVSENNELMGNFSESVTLDSAIAYKITGEVNFLSGTTLTIPAGTTLYGATDKSYLAINAGAKIEANGTADQPIIFTSAADHAASSTKDAQGEWGGLTIIGNAPIHGGTKTYEAGTQVGGGTDAADNSGTLKYVMIKHSGFAVEVDKELNGLSLLAVGSGTTISDVAVLGGADDGIEIWGGTVNLTNVYVYNAGDDSLDTDSGYTGTIDNAVVVQKNVDKTNYDSSGVESGNDSDTFDVSPTGDAAPTKPFLKNATINAVGGAIYIKNDSGYTFDNVIVNVKASTVTGQTDTADQAIVTHRTTDTVDDLSGTPRGITIAGTKGIVLNNEVTPNAIFATRTAKDGTSGGNTIDATHTKDYWLNGLDLSSDPYTGNIFVSSVAAGATNASVKSDAAKLVTGADQSVFGWVLKELNAVNTKIVSGDITADTIWTEGTNYALQGAINVISPATLTIEAGVTVYGLTPSSYLAINKGAKINAVGTLAKPITFTSAADVAGDNGDTIYQGQWGGLTIIGDAPIVGSTKTYEAGTQVGGGSNSTDNSGTLEYVAIKNSGFEIEADKELNGLSLLAVGSGTIIKNIAVLGGSDDGMEIWGGTVNVDGLYVYDAGDDSFDTDLGYTGTISNAYAQQYTVDKLNYDSSGIETGNDKDTYTSKGGNTNPIAEQATMPTFKNVTVEAVGGAIYLKNDAGGIFDNVSIISKTAQDPAQTAIAGQAIITHRTTDTVNDLSDISGANPYGVQILSGGLELINEVVATDIYATTTAKSETSGGDTTNAAHTKNYWEAIPDVTTVDADHLFYSDAASVTGADTANVWKGKAGTNNR